MFKTRIAGLYQLLHVCQIGLAIALFILQLSLFATFYPSAGLIDYERYGEVCVLMVLGLILSTQTKSFFKVNILRPSIYTIHHVCLRRCLTVLMLQLFFIFSTKNVTVSRFFLFTSTPLLYLLLFFTHLYLPRVLAYISFQGSREQRTLLCGSKNETHRIKYWLDHKAALGLRTIGVLTDDTGLSEIEGMPVLGAINELESVLKSYAIDQVLFLHIPEPKVTLNKLYRLIERHGARLLILNDLEEIIGHSVTAVEDDGLNFIGVRQEPLENVYNRALKRLLDIGLSLSVICFILPIASVIVKISQYLQSPGPLLHKQFRGGLHKHHFELLKFRTMHVHSEPIAKQATQGDERVYSLGSFFRRFSIDELPQFINVLRGNMSIVGPRPHLLEHDKDFSEVMGHYQVRSFVKPGITGLAQVRGFRGEARSKGELIARVMSDLYYIENWSLSMDLIIILRTAVQMLFPPRTAY